MRLMRDRGQRIRHGRSDTLSRLLKPLVQERDGPLPGQASSLGIILRAILLEEPMCSPRIRIAGDWSPRSLERLLHLCDRLRRYEGVILREVAEVGGLRAAKVQSGVGVIKGHDCSDLLGHSDGQVERVGASQREADEGELAATVRQMGRIVLAQDLHRSRDVAAHPLHIPIQRRAQRLRFLDRGGRLAVVEVGGQRHKARLREPVADLPKRLRQSPPRMQNHHPWSTAMLGNGQIAADRSAIRLKFSHSALLKHSRTLTKRCASRSIAHISILFVTSKLFKYAEISYENAVLSSPCPNFQPIYHM